MNKVKLNICIPYCNSSIYFSEAIESIVKQSYSNWEIFVYNDGSNSHETKLLNEILSKRTNKFHILGNSKVGVYRARINLLKSIKSGYVLFLDADDFYSGDNVFETIISKIQQTNSDIVYFNYWRYFKTSRHEVRLFENFLTEVEYVNDVLTNIKLNSLCNKAFNSKCVKAFKFIDDVNFTFAEDRLISVMLHERAKSITWINKPLYCYRDNPCSLSNSIIDNSRILSQINVEEIVSKQKLAIFCKNYQKAHYIVENIIYPNLWYTIKNISSRKERFISYKDILIGQNKHGIIFKSKYVKKMHRKIAIFFLSKKCLFLLDIYMKTLVMVKGRISWK